MPTRPSPIDPNSGPILRLVETLFFEAAELGASAILIDRDEGKLRIRYRVRGEFRARASAPASLLVPILARIKGLAGMKRVSRFRQEGRFTVTPKRGDAPLTIAATVTADSAELRLQFRPTEMKEEPDPQGKTDS